MDQYKQLKLTAAQSRLLAVDAVHEAKAGHPGGSLSCMDALIYLYFKEMNIAPYEVIELGSFDEDLVPLLRQSGSQINILCELA